MTDKREITLRQANEIQPEGVDAFGFPVGQFARELDALRRANAAVYAAAVVRRGAGVTQRARAARR